MFPRWLQKVRLFACASRASVTVMFSLLAIPMILGASIAIEFATISSLKTRLQSAADAAMLAGGIAMRAALDSGEPVDAAITSAQNAAANIFSANFGDRKGKISTNFAVNDVDMNGSFTITYNYNSIFSGVLGFKDIEIKKTSQTHALIDAYLNVYIILDVSHSMLLGATPQDMQRMQTERGCALACHNNIELKDSFGYALRRNIKLRYQVVNEGVANLVNFIASKQTVAKRVNVEVWALDHELRKVVPLTSDMSRIPSALPAPRFLDTKDAGATWLDVLMPTFVSAVGTSGDGKSAQNPKKLVIIATDGVNNPTKDAGQRPWLLPEIKALDTGFCNTLKGRGNTVAVINTPYAPMPEDWTYNQTLAQPGRVSATRHDDIEIVLRECAGKNFTVASNVDIIRNAFIDMYRSAAPVRLTQ